MSSRISEKGGERDEDEVQVSTAVPDGINAKGESTTGVRAAGPPNGGTRAWLQIVGAFFIYFNTWGIVATFGVFQAYYEKELLRHHTPFSISTIGSLQTFLMVFLGLFTGPLYDLGYARHLLWVGSVLIVIGTVTQSVSTTLWQLLLSQGVCIGVGMGSLAVLGVALPSLWFSHRLPLANGTAACGSGIGGLLLSLMFRSLQPEIGFGWTVRIIALIAGVTMGLTLLLMRTPQATQTRRALVDQSAFRDVPWLLFLFGCFVALLGMYSPFTYVQSYALDAEIVSPRLATYLLSIMNGASIPGRIIPNLFAQWLGILNTITMAAFALAVAAFCLMPESAAGLVIVVVIYGFFCGTFFAAQATTFVRLTLDRSYIGTRFGMAFSVMSIALLFGPPISGALLRAYGYDKACIWTGLSLTVGGMLMFAAKMVATDWILLKRV